MLTRFAKPALFLLVTILAIPLAALHKPEPAQAAASMFVSGASSVTVGQDISVTIYVNTGGASANAFDAHFSYPTNLFEGVRGTYSGSVCTLQISSADPSGGGADISCGKPSGYTGTGLVATVVLKALTAGSGNFGLSSCQVLANDGAGTDITGGCSGKSVTVTGAGEVAQATPTPTPTPGSTLAPTADPSKAPRVTPTPKPTTTPKVTPTPTPGGPAAPVAGATTPEPTPPINPPEATLLPESTPTPDASATPEPETPQTERRSIGQAVRDVFGTLGDFKSLTGDTTGAIALLLTMIPALALAFAIMVLVYRLYLLERRRRRTLDRLFELELSELASLEGKLDLLAEKGAKGKEQFKEEFKAAKENILRQIKPDYGKAVESPKKKAEEPPAAK
ncbi:MAG TPA: cohesin domain-containing protein [Verrucomicrobiae bacterium]|nr:cohesin domain-containing protein [Verrucomicrobiae bacterium]